MRNFLWLVGVLALTAGSALGQQARPDPAPRPAPEGVEPIPTPPAQPTNPPTTQPPAAPAQQPGLFGRQPPAPGERRERLRALGGQLLNQLTTGQPVGAPGAAPGLNVPRLNEAFSAILGPLVAGDTALESVSLALNPMTTNLARDSIGLSADVVLRRTAWSSLPTHLHIDLTAAADMSRPGGATATVETRVLLQTAVVPLADFALAKYKSRQSATTSTSPSGTSDELFKMRLAEKLNRTSGVVSFDDMMDLFQYIASLRYLAINDQIEQLKGAQAAAMDEPARQALAAQVVAARQQRDGATNVRPQIQRDNLGQARAITVAITGNDTTSAAAIERADIGISESEINVVSLARINKGVEVYALLKPIVLLTLDKLAQRDAATIDQQRALLQGFWGRARPWVITGP